MTALGAKVTQTVRQTDLETTFDINCNPRRHIEDRNCKNMITDIRICTTIMAFANRAANMPNSKH